MSTGSLGAASAQKPERTPGLIKPEYVRIFSTAQSQNDTLSLALQHILTVIHWGQVEILGNRLPNISKRLTVTQ